MTVATAIGAAAAAVGACAGAVYLAPQTLRYTGARELLRRCARTKSVALTFDDGPGAELTPRVLDLLARRGARATFFLLGFRAAQRPEIVDMVMDAGHEIGCHSHAHRHAWKTAPAAAVHDVRRGYDTLSRWVPPDGMFRPPYGKLTMSTWRHLRRRGAPIGWWTHASGDTFDPLPDPGRVARGVADAGGGVVLLHDFDRDHDRDARAAFVLDVAEAVLDLAAERGLRVVTLGDIMGSAARRAQVAG